MVLWLDDKTNYRINMSLDATEQRRAGLELRDQRQAHFPRSGVFQPSKVGLDVRRILACMSWFCMLPCMHKTINTRLIAPNIPIKPFYR